MLFRIYNPEEHSMRIYNPRKPFPHAAPIRIVVIRSIPFVWYNSLCMGVCLCGLQIRGFVASGL